MTLTRILTRGMYMGYVPTTNYGFQKPEKTNAFTVDDLNNALDKADEVIKNVDDKVQKFEDVNADSRLDNVEKNIIESISVDVDEKNNIKVSLGKADKTILEGTATLPSEIEYVMINDGISIPLETPITLSITTGIVNSRTEYPLANNILPFIIYKNKLMIVTGTLVSIGRAKYYQNTINENFYNFLNKVKSDIIGFKICSTNILDGNRKLYCNKYAINLQKLPTNIEFDIVIENGIIKSANHNYNIDGAFYGATDRNCYGLELHLKLTNDEFIEIFGTPINISLPE